MNRLTKILSVDGVICTTRLVGCIFGVITTCCSVSALADPLAGSVAEPEPLAWVGDRAQAMTDIDLSVINGKGAEALKLDGNERLAVILWDERGNGGRRTANHDIDGGQGVQSVNLTINHR